MNAVLKKINQLPTSWKEVAIEDVAEVNPRVNKSEIPDDLSVSFVPMSAVKAESGAIDVSQERPFFEVKKGFTPFSEGDVLFAKITPCMENGKMAVVPKVKNGYGFGSTEFHVLRPKEGMEAKYLYYFVSGRLFRGVAQHNMSGAVGQKRVPTNYLKQHLIPVAPPEQQKRIVAKIEELFSHIDAGIESLKRAKQLLKQYRQSILKAAVTGELTKEWREAKIKDDAQGSANVAGGRTPGATKLEPASQLLERILKERRQKWEEQQLEQFKVKGKVPKGDKWKDKYKDLVLPSVDGLEKIPEEWGWANWEAVLSNEVGSFKRGPFGSTLKKAFFVESGYKVYEQYCPINDDCSFERYYITNEKFKELEAFAVKEGDFLISCSGVTLGRITQVPEEYKKGVINQALLRVRINKKVINEQYFKMFFRSPFFQNHIFDNVSGVAIPNVKGVKELKAIPIPLPSIEEQLIIYGKVNERLSASKRLDIEIATQLKKAEKNKQSILASAFSGVLH